ncbi:MAG: class III extradiol ring-cleavage dioxygenase [Marinobacter sp.]|nr:class III extradiol ring-cleavage dioxygenase [Marinobacter sp.]
MSQQSLPTIFLPHGAGPCFFMDWQPADTWTRMRDWLAGLTTGLGIQPRALLVISAHWQAPAFTVTAQAQPALLFDYYGFPEPTYRLTWPAPGNPELAADVRRRLGAAGVPNAETSSRGLDHGVFIPLKLSFPAADVPVVQLSLRQGLDPQQHLAMGLALAGLRDEGVLIVGSGMSYHNMARFRSGADTVDPASQQFDEWLTETVQADPGERADRLIAWAEAPGARLAHPEEEHLLPLHVVAGAGADAPGRRVFTDTVMGSVQSAFVFGD